MLAPQELGDPQPCPNLECVKDNAVVPASFFLPEVGATQKPLQPHKVSTVATGQGFRCSHLDMPSQVLGACSIGDEANVLRRHDCSKCPRVSSA